MAYTVVADLTDGRIEKCEREYEDYGRGLAVRLLAEHTPERCARLGEENAFVLVPGLLTGAPVACANRATITARDDGMAGIPVGNLSGDLPQKLASLGIGALVIKGSSEIGDQVLYIDAERIELHHMPELKGKSCGDVVDALRDRWGAECAVIGCGPAADLCLPISSLFATYPEGEPRYSCPRSSFGDVPASKGLRAVVVRNGRYFDVPCSDRERLLCEGKRLARYIVEDPLCGGALPGLGSITLLHLLKNKENIAEALRQQEKSPAEKSAQRPAGKKINYCCAPMCVIGCLNRHSGKGGAIYHAPEDSEVRAAVRQCFGERLSEQEMEDCAVLFTSCGMDMGLNITELVYTAALYLEAAGEQPGADAVRRLTEELRAGTVTGRILGGGTAAVGRLFRDREDIQRRVTRPAVQKEKQYRLKLNRTAEECGEEISDLELLYREIFLFENLGICIFTSFALLNKEQPLQILAELYTCRIGRKTTVGELLAYSGDCLRREDALRQRTRDQSATRSIPEFVKVLYRYFADTDGSDEG